MELESQLGPFSVGELLAADHAFTVHRASRCKPDGSPQVCALECLRSEEAAIRDNVERFMLEARVTATLRHRAIASLYAFGRTRGVYFSAMEPVDFGSLEWLADRARLVGCPPPLAAIAAMLADVLEALDYARATSGVALGTVSTSRMFIASTGQIKIRGFDAISCESIELANLTAVSAAFLRLLADRASFRETADLFDAGERLHAILLRGLSGNSALQWPSTQAMLAAIYELLASFEIDANAAAVADWARWVEHLTRTQVDELDDIPIIEEDDDPSEMSFSDLVDTPSAYRAHMALTPTG